jgi:hypothetical protein
LEEVHLILSKSKSIFRIRELVIVEYMWRPYGQKSSLDKVNAINKMKDCTTITEVQRFLDACLFYFVWIPYFAHVANLLYQLLSKGQKINWKNVLSKAMRKLKDLLSFPSI